MSRVIAKQILNSKEKINSTLELVEVIKKPLELITFISIIPKEKYFKHYALK